VARPAPKAGLRAAVIAVCAVIHATAGTGERPMIAPSSVFEWTRQETAARVDSANIFEYMDGAGELYLGYRFDHLDAFTYKAGSRPEILLEIYFMKSSDDAYGLLSQDWGGEPTVLNGISSSGWGGWTAPESRVLYGAGLLRAWSGDVYLRIMASEETPESRAAVIELAGLLVRGRKDPPRPGLLGMLPEKAGGWNADAGSLRFFRSRHVMNSVYFVSYRNILRLGPSVEAVTATYEIPSGPGQGRRCPVFILRYPDGDAAARALAEFHAAYFPEHAAGAPKPPENGPRFMADEAPRLYEVEGGWAGYGIHGRTCILVFECPDRDSGIRVMQDILQSIQTWEANPNE
jgi:hypothetical protein